MSGYSRLPNFISNYHYSMLWLFAYPVCFGLPNSVFNYHYSMLWLFAYRFSLAIYSIISTLTLQSSWSIWSSTIHSTHQLFQTEHYSFT